MRINYTDGVKILRSCFFVPEKQVCYCFSTDTTTANEAGRSLRQMAGTHLTPTAV